jgi:hypothetical protein
MTLELLSQRGKLSLIRVQMPAVFTGAIALIPALDAFALPTQMLLPLRLLPLPLKPMPLSIPARSRRFVSIEGAFLATQFSQGNTHLLFYMMLCCCFLFCCLSRGDGGATRAAEPMA